MLNISQYRINHKIRKEDFRSLMSFEHSKRNITRRYLLMSLLITVIGFMFLPWTQNISSRGEVTSLYPEHRPQGIPSLIAGRIEKWYVQEGDFVHKGDTILFISEVRDEYFDPQLLDRTRSQIRAKETAVQNYREKVEALDQQIQALEENQLLRTKQARNSLEQAHLRVTADSIDLEAAQTNLNIALAQMERMQKLYDEGLRSRTDLETRKLKLQETQARLISQRSQLLSSRNAVINAEVEINSLKADFQDKLSKARSEKYASISARYEAEAELTKLENQLSNFSIRSGFYYITAPQNGYITQAQRTGIGETVQAGEMVVTIMPSDYQLAVAMYVRPIDLPLLSRGQDVRLIFDGWPAIVFSGWPGVTTGTFGGEVVAIDNFTNARGEYRVLVAADPEEKDWPDELRVGAGAKTITLLENVPIWYELWRQINGFPPNFYQPNQNADQPK